MTNALIVKDPAGIDLHAFNSFLCMLMARETTDHKPVTQLFYASEELIVDAPLDTVRKLIPNAVQFKELAAGVDVYINPALVLHVGVGETALPSMFANVRPKVVSGTRIKTLGNQVFVKESVQDAATLIEQARLPGAIRPRLIV